MLKTFLDNPNHQIELVFVGIAVLIAVIWLAYTLFGDSASRRRRIARRMRKMLADSKEEPGRRQTVLDRLLAEVDSNDRFTACYAAWAAGRLTSDFLDLAPEASRALARLLHNPDPFRRHAAAQALYEIGSGAEGVIFQLERAAEEYYQESSGIIAARLLRRLRGFEPLR